MVSFVRILICALVMLGSSSSIFGNPVLEKTTSSTSNDDVLAKCFSSSQTTSGILDCAAERSVNLLRRIANKDSIEIVPGVSLESNETTERRGKSIDIENEISLPANPKEKMDKLIDLIIDAANQIFSGRTLKIRIPEIPTNGVARAIEEGRKKMKKRISPLLIGLGVKALLFKGLLLFGLKLLAIKAAILAKIAFVVALVFAVPALFAGGLSSLKKTPFTGGLGGFGGGHGDGTPFPNYGPPSWTTNQIGSGWNSQYPYRRSIDGEEDDNKPRSAQDMAYSSQKP